MTNGQTSNSEDEAIFPTEWHPVNDPMGVEVRQLSDDTYELRSPSHTITIDSEGFNHYRTSDSTFEMWMFNHKIEAVARTDK